MCIVVLCGLPLLAAGCAGQKVRGRADAVGQIVKRARVNGAYKCAPKELALAEAHLRRARDELGLGNLVPGQRHVSIAHRNAQAAYDKSPPERCAVGGDADGDGCPDKKDQCPRQPEDLDGFEDGDCCPDPDNDEDGIADRQDRCPNEAEDRDGHADLDGCPDPDNDADGLADAQDRCPDQPEDRDGFDDLDGCPDEDNDGDRLADLQDNCPNAAGPPENGGCPQTKYKLVNVTQTKIELKQTIFFATNLTRILSRSFPLLNEVAQVLKDRPRIHVRIEGHTDSRSGEDYNQRLSEGRANAVRTYLVGRGVDPVRMEAIGYGESRPIASNLTRSGRSMNRRVEFVITRQ